MKPRPRAHRRPTRLLVTFWRPDDASDYREGRIRDLSATGCFVAADRPFPPPTQLQMRLMLGEERVDLLVEVVRTIGVSDGFQKNTGAAMGVRFQQPASGAVQKLLEHVRSR